MNKVLMAGVVLGVSYVAAAYVTGRQVQQQMDSELARLQTLIPNLKISEDHHRRGLFGSSRSTTIEVSALFDRTDHCAGTPAADSAAPALDMPPAAPRHLTIEQTITHGPLPGFGWPAAAAVRFRFLVDGQPAADGLGLKLDGDLPQLTARYGFTGNSRVQLRGGAGQLSFADGSKPGSLTVAWPSLRFEGYSKADLSAMEYEGTLPQLTVSFTDAKGEHGTLSLKDLRLQAQHEYPVPGQFFVYTGDDHLSLSELSFEQGGKPVFSATQFEGRAQGTLVEGLLDSTTRLGMQQIVTGGETLGPMHYDFSLRRLDPAAYAELMTALFHNDLGACPSPEQSAALFDKLGARLPALLKTGPVFSIDRISLGYQGKEAVIQGQVSLPATATPEQLANPVGLLALADASLTFQLPDALIQHLAVKSVSRQMAAQMALGEDGQAAATAPTAEQAAQAEAMAQAMVSQQMEKALASRWIVRSKDGVSSQIEYRNGSAKLNGEPLDLGALRGAPPAEREPSR